MGDRVELGIFSYVAPFMNCIVEMFQMTLYIIRVSFKVTIACLQLHLIRDCQCNQNSWNVLSDFNTSHKFSFK